MNTATLKRELALLRSSLAALTPAQSTTPDDAVAWAEGIAGLTLDPWQRRCAALRVATTAPQCDATKRQEHSGCAQGRLDRAAGRSCRGGLAIAAAVRLPLPQACPSPRRFRGRLPARDHDRGRAGLGRVGGQPAGRSSGYAARLVAAPRRPGGADCRRGISRPRRAMGDDLTDARRSARRPADLALDSGRRQR